jgi:hypothetical protein
MLELGVYLFNQLGKRPESKSDVGHLSAVVLVRPTKDNITKLEKELRKPAHSNYHICNNLNPLHNNVIEISKQFMWIYFVFEFLQTSYRWDILIVLQKQTFVN